MLLWLTNVPCTQFMHFSNHLSQWPSVSSSDVSFTGTANVKGIRGHIFSIVTPCCIIIIEYYRKVNNLSVLTFMGFCIFFSCAVPELPKVVPFSNVSAVKVIQSNIQGFILDRNMAQHKHSCTCATSASIVVEDTGHFVKMEKKFLKLWCAL